jgi:hypothetical protein
MRRDPHTGAPDFFRFARDYLHAYPRPEGCHRKPLRHIGSAWSAVKAFLTYAAYEDLSLVALSQSAKAVKAPAYPKGPSSTSPKAKPGRSLPRTPGKQ